MTYDPDHDPHYHGVRDSGITAAVIVRTVVYAVLVLIALAIVWRVLVAQGIAS